MKKHGKSEAQSEEPVLEKTELNADQTAQTTDVNEETCSDQSGDPLDLNQSDQNDTAKLLEKLNQKEAALAELSDKYMRIAAEYDNFRRRSQREKEALYTETIVEVVKAWLPVLDNLDRAEFVSAQYTHEDARKVCEGINMVQKQVGEVLQRLAVEEIVSDGKPFDPELHDAVMHIEDEQYDPSTVVEVLRKGYRLKDRVIRHVMVKVAN